MGENILVVGGGSGIASLPPIIEEAVSDERKVTVAIGAKTRGELLFMDRIKKSGARVEVSTDDGSLGYHGLVTELVEKLLEDKDYDQVLTCGPEAMIKRVFDIAMERGISIQASLERFMKCGMGICDSCAIDGYHVCKDGPIFDESVLQEMVELGKWRRDSSGMRVKI